MLYNQYGYLDAIIYISASLKTALNSEIKGFYAIDKRYSSDPNYSLLSIGNTTSVGIGKINETSFVVANSTYPTENDITYYWLAISGLT